MHVYANYYKKIFTFFSSQSIRMSGNSINFDDKKIKINDFYKDKNKKIFNIDDIAVNKILISKKVSYHANTLLGIMIVTLLSHYI